jgi:hypothetical protein
MPLVLIAFPISSISSAGKRDLVGLKSIGEMHRGSEIQDRRCFSSVRICDLRSQAYDHFELHSTVIKCLHQVGDGRVSSNHPLVFCNGKNSIALFFHGVDLNLRRSTSCHLLSIPQHTMLLSQIASPEVPAFVNPSPQNHQNPSTIFVVLREHPPGMRGSEWRGERRQVASFDKAFSFFSV